MIKYYEKLTDNICAKYFKTFVFDLKKILSKNVC